MYLAIDLKTSSAALVLSKWYLTNLLTINTKKTAYMIFAGS